MSLAEIGVDDLEGKSSMFEASELSSVTADLFFWTADLFFWTIEVFFLGPILE
mgnify:CR=1 FL=1